MKKCGRCKAQKDDSEFSPSQLKRSGGICRPCNTKAGREYRAKNPEKVKAYQTEYGLKYYAEHREQILEEHKEYYQKHKEEKLQWQKDYYQEHKEERQEYNKQYYEENREELLEYAKEYRIENIDDVREYQNNYGKERRANDPNFRIRQALSANIGYYLASNGTPKDGKSILNHLPYTMDELREHLEKQFEPWMSWDNYGRYDAKTWDDNDQTTWVWQIDHIIPHNSFKYSSMEDKEFRKCWTLNNLRPYSAKQNVKDGRKRK
jgi:hypothetical protein